MDDWVLGLALGILILTTGTLLLRLELCHKSLIYALQGANTDLKSLIGSKDFEIQDSFVEILKDELTAGVQDMMGAMKTPTAIDHLAGVAANIMQMREQWKIQKRSGEMNMINNLTPPTETHGTS